MEFGTYRLENLSFAIKNIHNIEQQELTKLADFVVLPILDSCYQVHLCLAELHLCLAELLAFNSGIDDSQRTLESLNAS
jgi:hypothetical protein